jgi:ABC-2 type transport system ATP-binding protein
MSVPAIDIQGLVKRYGDLTALNDLALTVQEGEFFGLLGPNGAGKTTTIKILAGLCNKTEGDVRLFGYDLIREYRDCRRVVGLVPQEFNFDQFVRVRRMLVFQAGFFGIPWRAARARADEIMREFDLSAKADSQIRQLSGGMKRRALIARALMHRPRLLILDEPTAGVDVDLRRSLWVFLRQLKNAGTTILLTTHYIEEAEALCDRIAIINDGRIIANDTTRRLVNSLQRETVIVSVAEPVTAALERSLSEFQPVVSADREDVTLSFDKKAVAYHDVLQRVMSAGARITNVRPVDNRLEQVYRQMTQQRPPDGNA